MNATEGLEGGHAIGILDHPYHQQLVSSDGGTRCALEEDGNLVIYRGSRLWESHTGGKGIVRAFFQMDGDFTLLDKNNKIVWHTNTGGHPGAYLLLQNDSNLVIYPRGGQPGNSAVYWNSGTGGGHGFLADVSHFASNAVKTAGRAIGSAIDVASSVTGFIGKAIHAIPVVGAPLEAMYELGFAEPFAIAQDISSGKRLDHVFIDQLHAQVADVQQVAPYAQMVVGLVPGIGTGISAGLGAGLALASGQGIDEALIAGVKGALPGGALAGQVFDVTSHAIQGAIQGKPFADIASTALANALPIPDLAKRALHAGLEMATHVAVTGKVDAGMLATPLLNEIRDRLPAGVAQKAFDSARAIGNGQAIADTVLTFASAALPKDLGKAVQIGFAMGHAQALQALTSHQVAQPSFIQKLVTEGVNAIARDPVLQAAQKTAIDGLLGFHVGVALMKQQTGHHALESIRNQLTASDKKGLDTALALHIGRVVTIKLPLGTMRAPTPLRSIHLHIGAMIAKGMMGAPSANKAAVIGTIAQVHPDVRAGAVETIKAVAEDRNKSIFTRIIEFLGFGHPISSAPNTH